MGFRSLFTKGVALSQAGQTNKHSRKASSLARQAMNSFRQARSLKADKKIDKALSTTALCPKVKGENEPGKTAILDIDIFLLRKNTKMYAPVFS